MKHLLLLCLLVLLIVPYLQAQEFADSVGSTGERAKTVATYGTQYSDRFPVTMGITGVAHSDVVTINATPIRLSDSVGVYRLNLIYIYNNTPAATVWISADSNATGTGIPITYNMAWLDGIGFFISTDDIWVATTSGDAELRVLLKYKDVY